MDKKIYSYRAPDGNVVQIEAYEELPSTAALAKEYAEAGYPDRYVVFADRQTTSQITGTRLKEGMSEEGIFMSCILRPSLFASQAGFFGIMSAVALHSALAEHTSAHLGIGWISDIYCEGVRIGGTMLEGKLDTYTAFEYLIVTFAVRLEKNHFPPRLTDMIRKVFESENASLPMIIGRTVLNRFFTLYPFVKTPQKFLDDYSKAFSVRGQKIKRKLPDGRLERVTVLGIDRKNGALMVETKKGAVESITARISVYMPKKIKNPGNKKKA